jgi:histidine ammonia-lyase
MVNVGSRRLTVLDFEQVLWGFRRVQLDSDALARVDENHAFLKSYSQHKIIYGINTGLGPMAQYRISDEDQKQLQYNLIRSHSSGAGPPLAVELARATMLARLNSLMQGYSGIHPSAVELLASLINEQITVCILERGGVGASGDLVQLAHLALNMIGEGDVLDKEHWRPAAEVFAERGISPLDIYLREGLAIMNGTSAMTGIGIVNILQANL